MAAQHVRSVISRLSVTVRLERSLSIKFGVFTYWRKGVCIKRRWTGTKDIEDEVEVSFTLRARQGDLAVMIVDDLHAAQATSTRNCELSC